MPVVTLPDGSQRPFDHPVTVDEVAASIGAGLRKAALAGRVDDKVVDTSFLIDHDVKLSIITPKDPAGLDVIRHSTAHLLAQAVKQLFPEAQVTIGPVIEDGFFYDFAYKRPFTTEDLTAIEARMTQLAQADEKVTRRVMDRDAAVEYFKSQGEYYKAEIIAGIPAGEPISLYGQGDWVDLCRGPHVPSTGKLTAFKLTKVAGAYWRGDSKNEMLQRIYGTAWADRKQLDEYLKRIEEAEKRDHRRIGRELDLFHIQEEGPGLVFWHPKGWAIWQAIEQYMRGVYRDSGYQEVRGPQVLDVSLWKKSGHWDNYQDNMFFTESEKRTYALKPMNCPGHVQIYNHGLHSYRDLPLRYGEFGACHRNEPSGALHGIMRVRAFTQDDAHIFCTEDQIKAESARFFELLLSVYKDCGFSDVRVRLANRPDLRAGTDEVWDRAERDLREAIDMSGVPYDLAPGEGAFYGPKLEFHLRDTIGRSWQCGTLQLDFILPERLDANYIGEDGHKHRPVMLHRAIFGSLERFIGVMIENYAGRFPLWLAPVQVVVTTITSDADDYARKVKAAVDAAGLRAEIDLRNEKINYKVREHSLAKVPVMLVVGKREAENGGVAMRRLGQEKQEVLALDEALNKLKAEAVSPADLL